MPEDSLGLVRGSIGKHGIAGLLCPGQTSLNNYEYICFKQI